MNHARKVPIIDMLTRMPEPSGHLPTIDTLKGLCMLMIFYVHFVVAWHADDWPALARFQAYIFDFVGPSLFATMSILGNLISIRKTGNGPGSRQSSPYSPRRLLRVSFLICFGEYLNLITIWRLGGFLLSAWNIVLTIAVFTLLLPPILRMRKIARVALAITIMMVYYPLVNATIVNLLPLGIDIDTVQITALRDPFSIIYWFFFYHDMMSPIFSWLVLPLLVSTIFEDLATRHALNPSASLSRELKKIGLWGIALITIAIVASVQRIPDYSTTNNLEITSSDLYLVWPFPGGMFPFLIRHTPQYMMYTIGIACVLFAIVGYIQMVARKKMPFETSFNAIGELSLTSFALSLFVFLIPVKVSFTWFYWVVIPLEIAIGTSIWLWHARGRRIGTLEWFMDLYVNIGLYLVKKHKFPTSRFTAETGDGNKQTPA
jgi:hypothetical protein